MGRILLDSYPLVVLPELACSIGLNEAIILQQLHYWIEHNRKKNRNFQDGRYWVYNSYSEWQKQFPWWSVRTIQRTFTRLEEQGLVISKNYNKLKMDRTKWYCIDYNKLSEIVPSFQIGIIECANMKQAIPETNTEENKQNKKITKAQSEGLPPPIFSKNTNILTTEKQDNIFRVVTEKYGRERAAYMLSVADWYIDQAYPVYTHREHPTENKAKRMVFAEKLLKCSDDTACGDQFIADTMHRVLREYEDCDPTIYYVTTPKVLGYWIIKDEEVGYESVTGTEYAPVDTIY